MKKIILILIFLIVADISLATDPANKLDRLLNEYQQQSLAFSSQRASPEKVMQPASRRSPYAMLYEHTGLYRWQLFYKCWYDYEIDTTVSHVDIDVDYRPIDDYFKIIPAYFELNTRRPTANIADFYSTMITALGMLGTDVTVLSNKPDNSYGYPGREYCQAFTYNSTRMVCYCRFLQVEDVSCVVYYMTSETHYKSVLYNVFFDLILDVLEFKPFTMVSGRTLSKPLTFDLRQNYPNPFNSTTTINYSVGEPSMVRLELFNINGSLVKTALNRFHDRGQYSVSLNLDLPSGIYFYKLSNDLDYNVKRMVLIK